jgi:hypothetical protein
MVDSGLMRMTDLEPVVGKNVKVGIYDVIRATAEDLVVGIRLKGGLSTHLYAEFSLGSNLLVDEDAAVVEVMKAIARPESEAADRIVKAWIKEPERVEEERSLVDQFLGEIEAGNIELTDYEDSASPEHPDNW